MEGDDVAAQLKRRVVALPVTARALAVVQLDDQVEALHSENGLTRLFVDGEVQQGDALARQGQLPWDER